ncbi:hypothetical protein FHT32_006535 [Variovorax sp. SG517]|uniref:hypothetical protein n=1 Tax=Variovorax sp. SG517 TaxID=2587117 RepID=UPI00159D6218|nr:hypothetical protein [Variovorax sp. SG517]NVM92842.1 hypothetical protein [Variovorax sp. SG517]
MKAAQPSRWIISRIKSMESISTCTLSCLFNATPAGPLRASLCPSRSGSASMRCTDSSTEIPAFLIGTSLGSHSSS